MTRVHVGLDLKTKPEKSFVIRIDHFSIGLLVVVRFWSKLEEGFQESLHLKLVRAEPKKLELIHPRMYFFLRIYFSFLQKFDIVSHLLVEWIVGKELVSIFLDWQNVHPLCRVPSVDYRGRSPQRLSILIGQFIATRDA